jgi:hypothetical protein
MDKQDHLMCVGLRIKTLETKEQQQTQPHNSRNRCNKTHTIIKDCQQALTNATQASSLIQKLFQADSKLNKKHTKNLETWVNMAQQNVHYLLNVKNQADDDPSNDIQPNAINQAGTTQPTNSLPTPSGSEASQVPPNTTA